MPVEVGDAVLRFLGDSTQLDTKFDQVQPNAEKAFGGAAEAVEEGTGRMKYSLHEAQGEARLLGEEFGIHLPRHVSTFLAKLPGVGEALSSVFSATAVLFLAQALVQATEKVTAFVANHFIYTQAQKDSEAATVELNKALLAQSANYDKAKDSIEKFGAAGSDSTRLQLEALKEQIETNKKNQALAAQQVQLERDKTHEYIQQNGWLSKSYDKIKTIILGGNTQFENLKLTKEQAQGRVNLENATVKALTEQQALLEKQLETEHKLEAIRQGGEVGSASAKLKAAQAENAVAEDAQTAEKRRAIAERLENQLYTIKRDGLLKQLAILKENDANTKDAQAKLLSELKVAADQQATVVLGRMMKEKDELQKTLQDMAKDVHDAPPIEPITPLAIQNMLKGIQTAHDLGITLRQDLAKAYQDAKKAEVDFANSGIQDSVARKQFAADVDKARRALENFGQAEDKFKAKSHGLWAEFRSDIKAGETVMDSFKQIGVTAFDDLSKNIQSAFSSIVLGQGNVAQALEKATAASLAQIASQAAVKALFYTGEGFAALAGFNDGSAAAYFTAAGEMAAVAAAAGIAGHELAGAGGSSGGGSNQQGHTSESNTSQSNRSGGNVVGVQGFSKGALITGPTLAIVGEEHKKEAVLPLEDPQSMSAIREGIGGGTTNNFHINGLVSDDKLVQIVGKINKLVNRGKVHLLASDSLRITKRSD
jgi:hypothetical protein